MAEEPNDELTTGADASPGRTRRLTKRLVGNGSSQDGRPLSVYIILFGGVAALIVLLFVIYLSSDRSIPDQPICSSVSVDQAQTAVLEGRIRGITVAYDDTVEPPSEPNWGPVLVRLSYTDGQCAILPQGITQQDRMFQLIGTITIYNDVTENQKVEIKYDRSTELDATLFATPTPLPPQAPTPSPTPEETDTATPTPNELPPLIGPQLIEATPNVVP